MIYSGGMPIGVLANLLGVGVRMMIRPCIRWQAQSLAECLQQVVRDNYHSKQPSSLLFLRFHSAT